MPKQILVVGGSTGIGAYLSREFSISGAKVFSVGRRPPDKWEDVGESEKISLDISNSEDLASLIENRFDRENFPVCVINCVGIGGGQLFISSNSLKWRDSLETNLLQPLNLQNEFTKQATAYQIPITSIMFSSLATEVTQPGNSIYGASKAALARAHKGMAVEYQKFGHVFYTLSPSLTRETPMVESLPEKAKLDYQNHLIFSSIELHEIYTLVKFLVGNRPKSMSGTEIKIGGTR
jgi:NAD(P)-dependent dehydrogenase (short-subunit alcohol dehydrogenase family)